MATNRIKSLLGLAQKAGAVISGSNLILRELARAGSKHRGLVLLAADATSPTSQALAAASLAQGCIVVSIPLGKDELGLAIGKSPRGYVMIKDIRFANRIIALLEEMKEGRP